MFQSIRPTLESIMSNEDAALVIGGGIAGVQASLDLAIHGFQVYLVEREAGLGGTMKNLGRLFPTLRDAEETIEPLLGNVVSNPHIKVIAQAEVKSVQG